MDRTIFSLLLLLSFIQPSQSNTSIAYNIPDPDCTGVFNLCTDADKERLGRQAIQAIHEQMDDDKDGKIEASESDDFIKEELESKTDVVRHHRFQNADLQITIDDLWAQWKNSAVYNWSNDEVIHWLVNHVHVPNYVENFRRNQIDGRMIPRLAANEKHYLSSIMQIRDLRLKRRLIIKATDIVLFGPPQRVHNLVKDMILMSALCISVGACLYAYVRHRKTQESMKRMLKDLETLQQAEGDLVSVTGKMKAMETELKEKAKIERGLLNSWFIEVQRTKEEADRFRKRRDTTLDHEKQLRLAIQEIEQLRLALYKAEEHAQHQSYEAPSELVDLLKRTYHIEETAFDIKRKSAESAMLAAKEQMQKISKMQKGFFGAVRIAHTGCMDNISELIHAAKDRLSEVHEEFEEREKRWNRIASLLDRDDLTSNLSSSSTSMATTQYLATSTNISSNNGITQNPSTVAFRLRARGLDARGSFETTDANGRSKQLSVDTNSLQSSNPDSPKTNKKFSNISNRGSLVNASPLTTGLGHDPINPPPETNLEYMPTSLTAAKRRTFADSLLINSDLSAERSSTSGAMARSNSSSNLHNSNSNLAEISRTQTYDTLDGFPSLKPGGPVFDIVYDPSLESNDIVPDDFRDRKSQSLLSSSDDRTSLGSSIKPRRSLMSTKLFKSFSNIRFRKKHTTT